jgi:hypothetical protein
MLYKNRDGSIRNVKTETFTGYKTQIPKVAKSPILKVWITPDMSDVGYASGLAPNQMVKVTVDNEGRIKYL